MRRETRTSRPGCLPSWNELAGIPKMPSGSSAALRETTMNLQRSGPNRLRKPAFLGDTDTMFPRNGSAQGEHMVKQLIQRHLGQLQRCTGSSVSRDHDIHMDVPVAGVSKARHGESSLSSWSWASKLTTAPLNRPLGHHDVLVAGLISARGQQTVGKTPGAKFVNFSHSASPTASHLMDTAPSPCSFWMAANSKGTVSSLTIHFHEQVRLTLRHCIAHIVPGRPERKAVGDLQGRRQMTAAQDAALLRRPLPNEANSTESMARRGEMRNERSDRLRHHSQSPSLPVNSPTRSKPVLFLW